MQNIPENYNRYVVVYFPEPETWSSVGSMVVDAPSYDVLEQRLREGLIKVGIDKVTADYIIKNDYWFYANCSTADFVAAPMSRNELQKLWDERHASASASVSKLSNYEITIVSKVGQSEEVIALVKKYVEEVDDIKVEHDVELFYPIQGYTRADRLTLKLSLSDKIPKTAQATLDRALHKEERDDPHHFPILRWLLVRIVAASE